jgi:hypothetical protein
MKPIALMSLFLIGTLTLLLMPTTTQAQEQTFSLNMTPDEGAPGTTITLEGSGAPPNQPINIYYAGYNNLAQCRAARGADGAIEVTADANGSFSTTAVVPQAPTSNALGVSYRAQIAPNGGFSNYRCFALPAGQVGRYFPETGHEIDGRFFEYWQQNGGLDVFGYPLTAERLEDNRVVQYLERHRLEYAPSNPPPYDVLLGRIGAEVMQQEGLDWRAMPTGDGPEAGCLYFEQTDHNVCNQLGAQGVGFLSYWQSNGLEFDGQPGSSYEESLALFGLPLTEPYDYEVEGQLLQVQWFERARFEWHPNNPAGFRVLLGRLGARLLQGTTPAPEQPPEVSEVQNYFIALGDEGTSGPEIGCGDSVIPVTINIEPTTAPLTAAFERLLAVDEEYYGQSGLYNALHRSDLTIDSATVENGQATVYLSGDLQIAGTCEAPRIEAQLRQTADQFSTVGDSVIFINGERLEDVVSQRD